jgi:hypothetical protein
MNYWQPVLALPESSAELIYTSLDFLDRMLRIGTTIGALLGIIVVTSILLSNQVRKWRKLPKRAGWFFLGLLISRFFISACLFLMAYLFLEVGHVQGRMVLLAILALITCLPQAMALQASPDPPSFKMMMVSGAVLLFDFVCGIVGALFVARWFAIP